VLVFVFVVIFFSICFGFMCVIWLYISFVFNLFVVFVKF